MSITGSSFHLKWQPFDWRAHRRKTCGRVARQAANIVWKGSSQSDLRWGLFHHAASDWRIRCGVEVTELSTNKQHTLSRNYKEIKLTKTDGKVYFHGKYLSQTRVKFGD
jgi:hypothetical protein